VGDSNTVWYLIAALCAVAAVINFALAASRRKQPLVALVRALAGLLPLGAAAGIVLGKALRISHPAFTRETAFIAFGVFIAVIFFLPSYIEKSLGEAPKVTLQQRAARPINATVRLRDAKSSDEWMN
jgi:hypothetical protein